jgi:hypothetical protein
VAATNNANPRRLPILAVRLCYQHTDESLALAHIGISQRRLVDLLECHFASAQIHQRGAGSSPARAGQKHNLHKRRDASFGPRTVYD